MEEKTSNGAGSYKKPRKAYGADMARAAFDAMDKEVERKNVVSSDADAFLDECEKADRNPIEVVKFLAGENGIELSGRRPEDFGKGHMYDVLREVVDKVVEGIFSDEDEDREDDDMESDGSPRPALPSRTIRPARKSVIVEYAFTW